MNNTKSSLAFFFIPHLAPKSTAFSSLYFHYLFIQAPLRTLLADYGLLVSIVMLKWIMVINWTKERQKQVWHFGPALPSSCKCSLQLHHHHTLSTFSILLSRSAVAGGGGIAGEYESSLRSPTKIIVLVRFFECVQGRGLHYSEIMRNEWGKWGTDITAMIDVNLIYHAIYLVTFKLKGASFF